MPPITLARSKARHRAEPIAKHILALLYKRHLLTDCSNKKLQKLLYYCQAWSLVLNKNPLFKNKIEAWLHGPVVTEVYMDFRKYGWGNIDKNEAKEMGNLEREEKRLISEVVQLYGKFDSNYLETLTHSEDPWLIARNGYAADQPSKDEISTNDMYKYYKRKYDTAKKTR